MNQKYLIGIGIGIVGIIAVGYGLWGDKLPGPGASQGDFVAVVNGERITTEDFESRLNPVKNSLAAQGQVLTAEQEQQLRQELLDQVIMQTLLIQYAKEQGLTATQEEIQARLEETQAQFGGEEALRQAMGIQGVTEKTLQEELSRQILIQELVASYTADKDTTASEEEIQGMYDITTQNSEQKPPFEEVRDQIALNIQQQKINDIMQALVDELRAQADIQIPS